MSFNAFVGGIEPGGLTNDFEVKILICYILQKIGEPLPFDLLSEAVQQTGFVNYFEFIDAVSELQRTEHVKKVLTDKGEELFQLLEGGEISAQTFHHTLPLTVREKTVSVARKLLKMQKYKEEIEMNYTPVDNGYMLTMRLKDIGSDLMNISVFIPSEDECNEIMDRIYDDPTFLYQAVLASMLGDYEGGKALFEAKAEG